MTFMKSSASKHGETVDEILQFLMEDQELMTEILDLTQSFPIRDDVKGGNQICVQEDILKYLKKGQIVEAAVGNTQLVWEFQNKLACECADWLKGKKSISDILKYADINRSESSRF